MHNLSPKFKGLCLFLFFLLAACSSAGANEVMESSQLNVNESEAFEESMIAEDRPAYDPGTLVEYIAQSGDTIQSLVGRFNTTREEIMQVNPIIPADVTTLPAGLPMQIPIYYRAYWGSQYQIIPDGLFPNGPAQSDFSAVDFNESQRGWMPGFEGSAARETISSAEIVNLVSTNFSISPRVLLALIEERAQGFSAPLLDADLEEFPLGYQSDFHIGLYLQLVWAANILNNGYYGWRGGTLIEFELLDGSLFRPDPWQNAASVAIQYLYAQLLAPDNFEQAIGLQGFATAYATLFGDPWTTDSDHISGSLRQPELRLPFISGDTWTHTGGPHTAWGEGEPWAALDFAPGLKTSGCVQTEVWATAVADGLVVRTDVGILVLDLDGDGDEHTGWVIFYLHLEKRSRAPLGSQLLAGQPLGHPSCEGGSSTGTHVHIARKYNGEWILASGDIPFIMENWKPIAGDAQYVGTLIKPGRQVTACRCSDAESSITSLANFVDFPTPSAFDIPLPSP